MSPPSETFGRSSDGVVAGTARALEYFKVAPWNSAAVAPLTRGLDYYTRIYLSEASPSAIS